MHPNTLPFTDVYTALTVKMGAAAVFAFYCIPQFTEGDTKGQRGPEDGPSVRAPTHKPQVFIRLGCVVQSSRDPAYQMFLLSGPGALLMDPKALRSRVVSYRLNSLPPYGDEDS